MLLSGTEMGIEPSLPKPSDASGVSEEFRMCSARDLGKRKKREGSSWQCGLKPVGQVGWGDLGVPRAEGKKNTLLSFPPLNTCKEASYRGGHFLASVVSVMPRGGQWVAPVLVLPLSPFQPPPLFVMCLGEEGGAWIRACYTFRGM